MQTANQQEHETPSAIRTKTSNEPEHQDTRTFYENLKPNRNFYFISRHSPLEYHVGATVLEAGEKKPREYHFSGSSLETLTMCTTMIRGPCCDWHHRTKQMATEALQEEAMQDTEVVCIMNEAEDQLIKIHSPNSKITLYYEGQYSMLTITEFIVQDSPEEGFVEGIRHEIESQIQGIRTKRKSQAKASRKGNQEDDDTNQPNSINLDMEMMDLECMLSCLPENELHVNPFTGSKISSQSDAMTNAVCTANLSLFLNEKRKIVNTDFWEPQNVQTNLTRLEDLSPKESAIWLDFTPEHPGSLQFVNAHNGLELQSIILSSLRALQAVKDGSYQSPLPLLTYVERERRFPLNFRQRKSLGINYEVFRNNKYQCRRSTRLVFSLHEAYHNPPHIVSTTILASKLKIEAEFTMSDKSQLVLRVYGQDNEVLDEASCTFEAELSEVHSTVVHATSLGLFEGECSLNVTLPKLKTHLPHDSKSRISLRIFNGTFSVC